MRPLTVGQSLLELPRWSTLSRNSCHFLLLWSCMAQSILRLSSVILGSPGLNLCSLSLSLVNFKASEGRYGSESLKQPCGMCLPAALVMIFLHIASPSRTDLGGLSLPKASSVSLVKLIQSAFLKLMNELLEELTTSTSQYSVVMIGKWSEPSALSVFQLVFITRLGLQSVMSGELLQVLVMRVWHFSLSTM